MPVRRFFLYRPLGRDCQSYVSYWVWSTKYYRGSWHEGPIDNPTELCDSMLNIKDVEGDPDFTEVPGFIDSFQDEGM